MEGGERMVGAHNLNNLPSLDDEEKFEAFFEGIAAEAASTKSRKSASHSGDDSTVDDGITEATSLQVQLAGAGVDSLIAFAESRGLSGQFYPRICRATASVCHCISAISFERLFRCSLPSDPSEVRALWTLTSILSKLIMQLRPLFHAALMGEVRDSIDSLDNLRDALRAIIMASRSIARKAGASLYYISMLETWRGIEGAANEAMLSRFYSVWDTWLPDVLQWHSSSSPEPGAESENRFVQQTCEEEYRLVVILVDHLRRFLQDLMDRTSELFEQGIAEQQMESRSAEKFALSCFGKGLLQSVYDAVVKIALPPLQGRKALMLTNGGGSQQSAVLSGASSGATTPRTGACAAALPLSVFEGFVSSWNRFLSAAQLQSPSDERRVAPPLDVSVVRQLYADEGGTPLFAGTSTPLPYKGPRASKSLASTPPPASPRQVSPLIIPTDVQELLSGTVKQGSNAVTVSQATVLLTRLKHSLDAHKAKAMHESMSAQSHNIVVAQRLLQRMVRSEMVKCLFKLKQFDATDARLSALEESICASMQCHPDVTLPWSELALSSLGKEHSVVDALERFGENFCAVRTKTSNVVLTNHSRGMTPSSCEVLAVLSNSVGVSTQCAASHNHHSNATVTRGQQRHPSCCYLPDDPLHQDELLAREEEELHATMMMASRAPLMSTASPKRCDVSSGRDDHSPKFMMPISRKGGIEPQPLVLGVDLSPIEDASCEKGNDAMDPLSLMVSPPSGLRREL